MSCLLSLFSDISHDLCSSYIDIVHIFLPHWYLWLIIGAFNIRKVNGRMSFWKSIWEKSFGSLPDFGCYYFRCLRVVNSCVFPIEEFNTFFFKVEPFIFYSRSENRSLTFLKNCSSNTIHTLIADANDDVYWFFLSIVIALAKPFVLIRCCCHSIDQYFQSVLNSFILCFFFRPGSQVFAEIDKASRFAFRQHEKKNTHTSLRRNK